MCVCADGHVLGSLGEFQVHHNGVENVVHYTIITDNRARIAPGMKRLIFDKQVEVSNYNGTYPLTPEYHQGWFSYQNSYVSRIIKLVMMSIRPVYRECGDSTIQNQPSHSSKNKIYNR